MPGCNKTCFRVYNDWLAEYCSYAPKRLKGLALISLYDPKEGAQELARCAKLGLKGAMIWCSPPADQPYSSPLYDPFWAAAQDLEMPSASTPLPAWSAFRGNTALNNGRCVRP